MLEQKERLITSVLLFLDILNLFLSFWLAYQIRLFAFFQEIRSIEAFHTYSWILLIAIPLWLIALKFQNMYQSPRRFSSGSIIWKVLKATVFSALVLGAVIFLSKAKYYSRILLALFLVITLILIMLTRILARTYLLYRQKKGQTQRNLLLAGINKKSAELIREIDTHPEWNLKLVGVVSINPLDNIPSDFPAETNYLGTIDNLYRIMKDQIIDDVIFTLDTQKLDQIENALLLCEELGLRAHLIADFFNFLIAKTQFGYLEKIPILTFTTTPFREFDLFIKRTIDFCLSFVSLLVFSPFFMFIPIIIKIDSPGPVIFSQIRVGLNGRRFKLIKFRSMVRDAENRKMEVSNMNEMNGPVFKSSKDPRVTRIGRWLRKLSLDELPQLINVLKGDMSLVGPRPPLPAEVENYRQWQRRRLSMKPGITCIWQISGRNEIDFEEWMKLDLQYIDHWSLGLDLKILLKTIPAVITGKGAN